jgi:hypothetical protein
MHCEWTSLAAKIKAVSSLAIHHCHLFLYAGGASQHSANGPHQQQLTGLYFHLHPPSQSVSQSYVGGSAPHTQHDRAWMLA